MADSRDGLGEPDVRQVAPGSAVVRWGRVRFPDIPRFQDQARATVEAALVRQGIEIGGPKLTFSRPPSDGEIEIAPGTMVDAAFAPVDGLTVQDIPAGRAAHLRLEGPYDRLVQAWTELNAWIARQGVEPAGLNWEVYGDGPVPVTDLYVLLK